jgi:hypothetical protein
MVEALQLLAEHEVLQDGGTSRADLQTQLVLDRGTPVGGHVRVGVVGIDRQIHGRSHGVNTVTARGEGTGYTSSIGQAGNGQRKPCTSHLANWIAKASTAMLNSVIASRETEEESRGRERVWTNWGTKQCLGQLYL